MQLKYLRLINDLFMEVNPIPVKDAMNQLGMPSGPCRMPLLDMSDEHKAAMQSGASTQDGEGFSDGTLQSCHISAQGDRYA